MLEPYIDPETGFYAREYAGEGRVGKLKLREQPSGPCITCHTVTTRRIGVAVDSYRQAASSTMDGASVEGSKDTATPSDPVTNVQITMERSSAVPLRQVFFCPSCDERFRLWCCERIAANEQVHDRLRREATMIATEMRARGLMPLAPGYAEGA